MEPGLSVVWGLRVSWYVVIVVALIGLLPLGAVSEFVRELCRRGKLKSATSVQSPPRFTVPQRWFSHFYILGILVNTILLAVAFLFAYICTFPLQSHESKVSAMVFSMSGAGQTHAGIVGVDNVPQLAKYRERAWSSFLLLAMLEIHLLRRLFESVYMFHYSPLARMHILGYFAGLGYCHLLPFHLLLSNYMQGSTLVRPLPFSPYISKTKTIFLRSIHLWFKQSDAS